MIVSKKYNRFLKPNKTAFITYRWICNTMLLLLMVNIVFFVFPIKSFFFSYACVLVGLWSIWNYVSLNIQYKKEKYRLLHDKIILQRGGVFSDYQLELSIPNITNISLKTPWIAHQLFGIGHVSIESAGTQKTEIYLTHLNAPRQAYQSIEDLMRSNGFKLSKTKVLQQETPDSLGAFFETVKVFIGFVFVSGILIAPMLDEFYLTGGREFPLFPLLTALVLLLVFCRLHFLDLTRRVYRVFNDAITYEEGFLSKNYALIPIENLSDSTITQTFFAKLFNLYNVKISCQGSNQEILFHNIVNGPQLEETISTLIVKSKSLIKSPSNQEKLKHRDSNQKDPNRMHDLQHPSNHIDQAEQSRQSQSDTQWTTELRMDIKRILVPWLLLTPLALISPYFLIFIALCIVTSFITARATTYRIKSQSTEKDYHFLNHHNTELNNEKITGIIFKENILDRWFATCSIQFWSLGSSQQFSFSYIKKSAQLEAAIVSKIGLYPQKQLYQIQSQFSFIQYVKNQLFFHLWIIGCGIALFFACMMYQSLIPMPIVVGCVVGFVLIYSSNLIYSSMLYKRCQLTFYPDSVFFKAGLLTQKRFYIPYTHIKDQCTLQYAFSDTGNIALNVAGEILVQSNNQSNLVSNGFTMKYVSNLTLRREIIEAILYKCPTSLNAQQLKDYLDELKFDPLYTSKPDLGNSMFWLIIFSMICFPLLVILPLSIPLVMLKIKAASASIFPHKVESRSGLFYQKIQSIFIYKIDHINYSQGAVNKLFTNGNIMINTVGSSQTELEIKSLGDYQDFYTCLKKHMQQ